MTDFTYDNEDFTAIRVATADLNKLEREVALGAFLASISYIGWRFAFRKAPGSLWSRNPLLVFGNTFVSTSIVFTLATWRSRSRLDEAAAHINTKYSSIISRTLNYEGILDK